MLQYMQKLARKNLKVYISASDHVYKTKDCTKTATCTYCKKKDPNGPKEHIAINEPSCNTLSKCKICGKKFGEYASHKWNEATCTKAKTCNVCGKTEGKSLGHNWDAATCLSAKKCTRCGQIEGQALGHDWSDATCEDPKECLRCGEISGQALGHDWIETSCEVFGECSRCGKKSNGDWSKYGHVLNNNTIKPIYEDSGVVGFKNVCPICNKEVVLSDEMIPMAFKLKYRCTFGFDGENKAVLEKLYDTVDSIIKVGMTDEEKVKAIHDYLCNTTEYCHPCCDYGTEIHNGACPSIKGPLVCGTAICNGYALAFYGMSVYAGLECRMISGSAGRGHAWNQVEVNGKWYYIDCTWDAHTPTTPTRYDYYLSEVGWEDHTGERVKDGMDSAFFYSGRLIVVNDNYDYNYIYYPNLEYDYKNEYNFWTNYYICGQKWG